MPVALESFPYPPLPAGVDAIRILSIEPGEFPEPLRCELIPVAFSAKPRYTALSYTWSDPYPDSATLPISPDDPENLPHPSVITEASGSKKLVETRLREESLAELSPRGWTNTPSALPAYNSLPTVTLNDQPFQVAHNLYLAILHLRSTTQSLALWIDAVCINQTDKEERNAQVALMSFIYTRALNVVAWLGVKEYSNQSGLFHSMYVEWMASQVRLFGASQAGSVKLRYSSEPDSATAIRIANNPYWTRMWIVQEVCLPRQLVFVYGSKIWRIEDLEQWEVFKTARARPAHSDVSGEAEDNNIGAIRRLVDTRNTRHTDMMRLEKLIEVSAKKKCTEVRDRIYGLLGLANDVHPLSRVDGEVDPVEEYVNSLDLHSLNPVALKRGRGTFKIDYSRPLYDIWTDAVKFVFFRARNIEKWYLSNAFNALFQPFQHSLSGIIREERRISVVRTAGVIQAALDQKVEDEMNQASLPKESISYPQIHGKPVIRAEGYFSGEIVQLGPTYKSFVGSFRAQEDWINCWEDHYDKPADFETLRRINEKYTAEVLNYEEKHLARLRQIRNPNLLAWPAVETFNEYTDRSGYVDAYSKMWEESQLAQHGQPNEPGLFLGTNYLMGLVPPAARIGDRLIGFWNCNAAIVVRPITGYLPVDNKNPNTSYLLLGRADVAEIVDRKATPGRDLRAERGFLGLQEDTTKKAKVPGVVRVDMDFLTLQMITASIIT